LRPILIPDLGDRSHCPSVGPMLDSSAVVNSVEVDFADWAMSVATRVIKPAEIPVKVEHGADVAEIFAVIVRLARVPARVSHCRLLIAASACRPHAPRPLPACADSMSGRPVPRIAAVSRFWKYHSTFTQFCCSHVHRSTQHYLSTSVSAPLAAS